MLPGPVEKRFVEYWGERVRRHEGDSNKQGKALWQSPLMPAEVYRLCFYAAARRISVALNSVPGKFKVCKKKWLNQSDDWLREKFEANRLDGLLYKLAFIDTPRQSRSERWASDFYIRFQFFAQRSPKRVVVRMDIPDTFLYGTYEGLCHPKNFGKEYAYTELSEKSDIDPGILYRDCATNYLVRNFWHNYTHHRIHQLTYQNYRDVSGEARYVADFEADVWSYVFLAMSYGYEVCADNVESLKENKDLVRLFRRNRCNEVFRLRAQLRRESEQLNSVGGLEAREWRYRRSLANYLSGWLIGCGRAAVLLGISLTGDVRVKRGIYHRKDAKVVVQVNRIRIPMRVTARLDEADSDERKKQFQQICHAVDKEYAEYLERDERLREFARTGLKILHRHVHVC